MKRLFVCSTPYHVFVSICIVMQLKNGDNDLILLNHSSALSNIYDNIKKEKIFKKIFFIDSIKFEMKEKNYNTARKLISLLKYYKKPFDYLPRMFFDYDEFYSCGHERITDIANIACHKGNKSIKNYLYEEGIASYTPEDIKNSKIKNYFNKIMGCKYLNYENNVIYLFFPDLAEKNFYSKIIEIQIEEKKIKKLLNKVFLFNDCLINSKYIYLDQPIEDNYNYKFNEVDTLLKNEFFVNNIAIKLHPRSKNDYKKIPYEKINSEAMWEMICLNNSVENKVLISVYSTACFTPKILFGQEPQIIFLLDYEKISFNGPNNIKEKKHFIQRYMNLYSDSSKICIPKNIDELKNFLDKKLQNINNEVENAN